MIYSKDNKEIRLFDTIILGNNLASVYTAVKSAKQGHTTAIVFGSELLCSEFSINMCLNISDEASVADFLKETGINARGNFVPQGTAVKGVLKKLRELGVCVLPKMVPMGYMYSKGKKSGVVVATKFGSYLLKGKNIIEFEKEKTNEYIFSIRVMNAENAELPVMYNINSERISSVFVSHDDIHTSGALVMCKFCTSETVTPKLLAETVAEVINYIRTKPDFENIRVMKTALEPFCVSDKFCPFPAIDDEYIKNILSLIDTYKADGYDYEGFVVNNQKCDVEYTGKYLDDFLGISMPEVSVPVDVMKKSQTDLIIAGLGTGGMAALKGALDSGCKNITAIDCMPLPGGTTALGMVVGYWHGYKGGYAAEDPENVERYMNEKFKDVPYELYVGYLMYYSDLVGSLGISVRMSSVVFGAVVENDFVKGIMVAGPCGAEYIECNYVVDTTGDGDVAVMSGCEYRSSGDIRDGVTQGYSIWGDIPGGVNFNDTWVRGDDDSISAEYYSEFLRGLLLTQSRNSEHGFSPMLTVRESRSIKGRYVINLNDAVNNLNFNDTITASTCVYDAHGVGTGLAYYTDLFTSIKPLPDNPDFMIRIPLKALMPEKINNLLIASKAISATRDAGCMIRMNADIVNVGYAAGYISGKASVNKTDFESAFDDETRKYFAEKGMYPEECGNMYIPSAEELADGVICGDLKAVTAASLRKDILPVLEKMYPEIDSDNKYYAGIVLAALGSRMPFKNLLGELKKLSVNPKIITNNNTKVATICILLSLIARDNECLKNKFLDVLVNIIDVAEAGGEPVNRQNVYQNSKVSNRVVPNYRMLLAIAISAEIAADEKAAKHIEKLMNKKYISVDENSEIHSVHLWMRLAAACMRCGNVYGAKALCSLLDNEHVFFRNFASAELGDFYDISSVCTREWWLDYADNNTDKAKSLKYFPELWY